MKHIVIYLLFLSLLEREVISWQSMRVTTADRIRRRGYSSEIHEVTTKDGYILSLFRITRGTNSTLGDSNSFQHQRPVVLMMHGLVSSSDCWVIGDPGNMLAFTLADRGYDVWLGNSRGTTYSKRHVSMKPDERRFWRYSWHELGVMDLPITIDYILKVTHQASLHYVGHSQGTAMLFVLLSTQPKYNKKLKTSHLMAPIAYMANVRSRLIRYAALIVGEYSPLDPLLGDTAFMQQRIIRMALGLDMCRDPTANPRLCAAILYSISGGVSGYMNQSLLPEIFDTHPTSCSTHQAIHLVQLYVSGHFRPYDFGLRGNMQRYGRPSPPDYKVENINPKFPLNFYYSDYDELSSKRDVEHFAAILGNKTVRHFINLKQFSHIDFLWASNVGEVLNQGIIDRMNEMELKTAESN